MPHNNYKKKLVNYKKIAGLLVLVIGVGFTVQLTLSRSSFWSKAAETYQAAALGSRNFYRTNIAVKASPSRCSNVQTPQGVYDAKTNKTYIAYPAGSAGPSDKLGYEYNAEDPYIVAFNHATNQWEGPFRVAALGGPTDCHAYPQILVDDAGYIHLYNTFHVSGRNITHIISSFPGKIDKWNPPAEIPNTGQNTYGALVEASPGNVYLFYRSTEYDTLTTWTSLYIYEPEKYVKSTDYGRTWSAPRYLVDPGRPTEATSVPTNIINDSHWSTIYMSKVIYDPSTKYIHFAFTPFRNHYMEIGELNYAYLDTSDDNVHNAAGVNLGTSVNRNQYTFGSCCKVFSYGTIQPDSTKSCNPSPTYSGSNTYSYTLVLDNPGSKIPNVYYTGYFSKANCPPTFTNPTEEAAVKDKILAYYGTGNNRLKKFSWNGSAWVDSFPGGSDFSKDSFGNVSAISESEYRPGIGTDLYVKTLWGGMNPLPSYFSNWPTSYQYQYPLRVFNNNGGGWTNAKLFSDHPDWEVRGVSNFNLIRNATPYLKFWSVVPKYDANNYTTGPAFDKQYLFGAHYVWGEAKLTLSNSYTPDVNTITSSSCFPNPQPANFCASFVSTILSSTTNSKDTCSQSGMASSPKAISCVIDSNSFWITNNMAGAAKVKYIEVPIATYCSSVSDADPGWTSYEDYTQYKYWTLKNSSSGDKKICAKYKDNCNAVANSCGATINRK